jgi:8-oxo-dGTP pyrophosphatase MutT (NUDIX family)
MEIGEGTEDAATRETLEEAGAQVAIARLIGQLSVGKYEAGQESLEVRLFDREEIPWNEIAFPVVKYALRRYVDDVSCGIYRLHVADLPDRLV